MTRDYSAKRAQIRVPGSGLNERDLLRSHGVPASVDHDGDDFSVLILVSADDRYEALSLLGEEASLEVEIDTDFLITYGDGIDATDLLSDYGIEAIPVDYDGEQVVLSVPANERAEALSILGMRARPYEVPDIAVPRAGTHIITYGDGIDAVDLLRDHDIGAEVAHYDGHQTVVAVGENERERALSILGMRARPAT